VNGEQSELTDDDVADADLYPLIPFQQYTVPLLTVALGGGGSGAGLGPFVPTAAETEPW
jgi:hypothetical protein